MGQHIIGIQLGAKIWRTHATNPWEWTFQTFPSCEVCAPFVTIMPGPYVSVRVACSEHDYDLKDTGQTIGLTRQQRCLSRCTIIIFIFYRQCNLCMCIFFPKRFFLHVLSMRAEMYNYKWHIHFPSCSTCFFLHIPEI